MTKGCPAARGWHEKRKVINGTTYSLRRVWRPRDRSRWQSYCEGWQSAEWETRRQACVEAHEHADRKFSNV